MIEIGDLIPTRIDEGLAQSRHVICCMSPSFFNKSDWGELERAASRMMDPASRKGRVLPVLIEECELPPTLKPFLFADYTGRSQNELGKLYDRIVSTRPDEGLEASDLRLTPPGVIRDFMDRCCPKLHRWLTGVGAFGLDFPPEHAELEAYNEEVYAKTASELHEKTVIALFAKSLPGKLPSHAADGKAFHSVVQQVVREIEGRDHSHDTSSATISALSRKSRPVRNLVSRVLHAQEPLILLGEPGSGKSLTIHQARLLIAENNRFRVFPVICLYANLGEFYVEHGNLTETSVADFVKGRSDERIRPYLRDLRRNGRLVVFLDGMDEMSRRRYNEHVQAISDYSRAGAGKAKTIVACRTADFSPKFQHRRLILLPFKKPQILRYLRRQFAPKTVLIGEKHWSLPELAGELSRPDRSIDARTPYVLWMFCGFIQDQERWPGSRVELLRHYYKSKLRESLRRLDQDASDPSLEGIFAVWGLIAFEIAIANEGVAISLEKLRRSVGEPLERGLMLGRACGALERSLGLDEESAVDLVKFEHHRAEEFFAAYHIHTTGEWVGWQERLQYPQWRETLLNVLLLGGGGAALAALEDALDQATAMVADPNWRLERELAERVEFAARAHADAYQSSKFGEQLSSAVYHLARHGHPITRIKMLEIASKTPDVDVFRAAEPSLDSEVQFLRTQALAVASASGNKSSKDLLPDQLRFAFANGEFPRRLGDFVTVALRLHDWRPMLLILAGVFLFALSPAVQLTSMSAAVDEISRLCEGQARKELEKKQVEKVGDWFGQYKIVERLTGKTSLSRRLAEQKKKSDAEYWDANPGQLRDRNHAWDATSRAIASPWTKMLTWVLGLASCIVAIFKFPRLTCVSGIAGGAACLLLVAVGALTWQRQEGLAFLTLAGSLMIVFWAWLPLYVLALSIFVLSLVIYCWTAAQILQKPATMRRYVGSCWDPNSDFALKFMHENAKSLPSYGLVVLSYSFGGSLVFDLVGTSLPDPVIQWLLASSWRQSVFIMGTLIGLQSLFFTVENAGTKSSFGRKFSIANTFAIGASLIGGASIMILIVFFIESQSLLAGRARSLAVWAFRLLMAIAAIAVVGGVLYGLLKFIGAIGRDVIARTIPARDSRSWIDRFAHGDPSQQAIMLRQVSTERMGLDAERFLDFLEEIRRKSLKPGDPPSSAYWRKWQEADELARLARHERR